MQGVGRVCLCQGAGSARDVRGGHVRVCEVVGGGVGVVGGGGQGGKQVYEMQVVSVHVCMYVCMHVCMHVVGSGKAVVASSKGVSRWLPPVAVVLLHLLEHLRLT